MSDVVAWVQAHPLTTLAIALYVFVNLAPRPLPEQATGHMKTLWSVLDRLSVLTARRVPGRVKWLFASSPAAGDAQTPPLPKNRASTDADDDEEGQTT